MSQNSMGFEWLDWARTPSTSLTVAHHAPSGHIRQVVSVSYGIWNDMQQDLSLRAMWN
jgi:hypothetical protein